jgi:hypothetical protein
LTFQWVTAVWNKKISRFILPGQPQTGAAGSPWRQGSIRRMSTYSTDSDFQK